MNLFNIERAFRQKKERKWEFIAWAIDLHDTIIEGKYNRMNEGREFYPDAKEVLQKLTKRQDTILILWTCSKSGATSDMLRWFKENDIHFNYVNANHHTDSITELCDFRMKFYFNILLDDKAGFEGKTDWTLIKNELIRLGEW